MEKSRTRSHAVILHGSCSLHGKPCLPGIRLMDSIMEATASLRSLLSDDFNLVASVEIQGCPRPCQLVISVEGRSASVFCGSEMLAEARNCSVDRLVSTVAAPSDIVRNPLVRHGR